MACIRYIKDSVEPTLKFQITLAFIFEQHDTKLYPLFWSSLQSWKGDFYIVCLTNAALHSLIVQGMFAISMKHDIVGQYVSNLANYWNRFLFLK